VLFLSCAVSGVLLSVDVCVCDLLIFLHETLVWEREAPRPSRVQLNTPVVRRRRANFDRWGCGPRCGRLWCCSGRVFVCDLFLGDLNEQALVTFPIRTNRREQTLTIC